LRFRQARVMDIDGSIKDRHTDPRISPGLDPQHFEIGKGSHGRAGRLQSCSGGVLPFVGQCHIVHSPMEEPQLVPFWQHQVLVPSVQDVYPA